MGSGWADIDQLGQEYHREVLAGYGHAVKLHVKPIIDTRSYAQKHLAQEIITNTKDLQYSIALKLINGSVHVNRNGRMVWLSAKNCGADQHDLVAEGAIAIIQGLHQYNPALSRMSTFLNNLLVFKMHHAAHERYRGIIRVTPAHERTVRRNYDAMSPEEHGAVMLGRTNEYVPFNVSLKDDATSLEGRIQDDGLESFYADKVHAQIVTAKLLKTLSEQEEQVLRRRFGLDTGEEESLEEIGQSYGLTRERIRQIEAKALKACRSRAQRLPLQSNSTCYL